MYFDESHEAVIPGLYLLYRGLSALESADESTFLFNSVDTSGTSAVFGSRSLDISEIKALTDRLITDIESECNRLLFHNPIFTLSNDEFIHDEPRSRAPDWGFVDDQRNSWNNQPTFLQYIVSNPDILARFGYTDEHGHVVWLPGPCHRYMKEIFDLQMNILVAVVLTFGEPGRGSELLSHLFRNVAGGSIRNVFSLFNIFALRGSFNKTSHATLRDRVMARVPLPSLGRLFIRFLAYLRPIFVEWQRCLRPHMLFNASHFLFAGLQCPLVTKDLSDKLHAVFEKEFKIPMNLALYRQFCSWITSCNDRLFSTAHITTSASDDQFGHTGLMDSQHYDGDHRLPDGLDRGMFMSTARTSATWQILHGHPPELMILLSKGGERQTAMIDMIQAIRSGRYVPSGQEVFVGSSGVTQGPHPAITSSALVEGIRSTIFPELFLHGTRALAQAHAAVVDLLAPNKTFPHSNPLTPTVHRFGHPFILQQLRQFMLLDDELAGFTCSQQAEVTQLLYDGQRNVGYFAATGMRSTLPYLTFTKIASGSGKTTPGLLNAYSLDGGRSTIWLLPLKSMHEQYKTRCRKLNMTYEVWSRSTSHTSPPRNIIVTIEHTNDAPIFHDFVRNLVASGLLARVIADEAHMALTQDSFRPVMHTLTWLGLQSIPIVLLSGSAPPHLEPALFAKFGVSQYTVCRGNTCRPNISYNVIRAKEADMEEALTQIYNHALAQSATDQILIFCRSKGEAEAVGKMFGIPFCHSLMDQDAIDALLLSFRQGKIRAIATSPILGVALDVGDVVWVIHFYWPYNTIGYIQETGRAGRKVGSKGFSYMVLPSDGPPAQYPKPDLFGARLIRDSAMNDTLCRRLMVQAFNDGVAEPCSMMPGISHFCDNCRRSALAPPQRGALDDFSLDMVNQYLPADSR
jgi:hypothetical protein